MKLLKSRKLTKSNCPLFSFFSFVTPRLASYFGKGLNVFIIFSVVLSILFWCPVKSSALNTVPNGSPSHYNYDYWLTECSNKKISRIEIRYSEPFSMLGYDVNYMMILLPNSMTWTDSNHNSVSGGAWPYILNRSSSSNQNKDFYNPVVQLFSSNDLFVDYATGNALDSSLAILRLNNITNNWSGYSDGQSITGGAQLNNGNMNFWVLYGYQPSDNSNFNTLTGSLLYSGRSTSSTQIYRTSAYKIPFYGYEQFDLLRMTCWLRSDGLYFVLGNSYQVFHNVDSINFVSGNGDDSFDSSGVQEDCECNCQNCCQCDCGYYTEELKEELVSYFETNMVTREMFEEFVENNTYVQNYYESQQEEISSLKDNTEFSSEVDAYNDSADNMFSDINNALDGLDDFESHLTLGSEIQGAGTIINSMFSNFPPSIIVAMVFVLVMLVVVKIIGR